MFFWSYIQDTGFLKRNYCNSCCHSNLLFLCYLFAERLRLLGCHACTCCQIITITYKLSVIDGCVIFVKGYKTIFFLPKCLDEVVLIH